MNDQTVLLTEVRSNIGTITLNRPHSKNALSIDLLVEIHRTLTAWSRSDDIRCVIVTGGTSRAFSSGYDISSIPTMMTPEIEEVMHRGNPLEFALDAVFSYPYPTIAMMNGYAFGAGLNLALCCDMRIAASDVKVGMPPARLGLVYHPDGLRRFIEVVGMARTREIFFTGNTYEGEEALAIGLVDRLVPREELEDTVYAVAETIAGNAPLALKGTKRILSMISERTRLGEEEMNEARRLMREAFESDDLKEGQVAFFEKRPPRFSGK
ncbi:MAG TPA: enoyl-CoA hydratase-related protein [Deltaproteobacteria bacterium]|nr:enoyl-CoA hydratase-related protein [Deltaproteobacteria bacterium]HOM28475.1 enoyl-CoA hydratase-related protein [Deltaproteobacteria bacterium]